jgi:hypothetical protein
MRRRDFLPRGGALAATAALPVRAAYPEKPVRYIIAFAPGGESDIAARLQQTVWRKKWGQELVVESKPGAGGALAWSQLNGFPGDGYTIMGTNMPHLVLQPLEGNVQYQTDDIVNVIFFNYTPDAIVVRSGFPVQDVPGLHRGGEGEPGKAQPGGVGHEFGQPRGPRAPQPGRGNQHHLRRVQGNRRPRALAAGRSRGCRDELLVVRGGAERARRARSRWPRPSAFRTFPDTPTFREVGIDWVDGGYRGAGVPKSTPEDLAQAHLGHVRRDQQGCGLPPPDDRAGNRDHRRHLRQDARLSWRSGRKAYVAAAKLLGLVK